MAHITAEQSVQCPPQTASALIESAIRDIGHDDTLLVRVPLDRLGENGVALEHEVTFRVTHARDASGLNDLLAIAWGPNPRFPMPAFQGTLTADWNEDATQTLLSLEGTYDPPGGIAGGVFDEIVGSRIAEATMHDLLKRTAEAIEARYQRTTGV